MFDLIKTNLLVPLIGRVGTFVATLLGLYGVQAEPAQAIGAGVGAAAALALDLLIDRWVRVDAQRKAREGR